MGHAHVALFEAGEPQRARPCIIMISVGAHKTIVVCIFFSIIPMLSQYYPQHCGISWDNGRENGNYRDYRDYAQNPEPWEEGGLEHQSHSGSPVVLTEGAE